MSKRERTILIATGEYLGCVEKRITLHDFHVRMASFANVNAPKEKNVENSSGQSSDGSGRPPDGVEQQSVESFMDSLKDIKAPSQISIEKLDKLLKEKEEEIKQLNLPKIRRYNFTTAVQEQRKATKQAIYNIAFCDYGKDNSEGIFAAVGGNRVSVYHCNPDGHIDLRQVYVDDDETEDLYCCKWTFDEEKESPLLLCAGFKGIVKVIDCRRQMLSDGLIGHGNAINELCVHPVDPYLVLSASKDESIRMWNLTNRVCIAIFAGEQGHRDEVLSIDMHLMGNCFASSGMDNSIKIWALDTEKIVNAIEESYTQPSLYSQSAEDIIEGKDLEQQKTTAASTTSTSTATINGDAGAPNGVPVLPSVKPFKTLFLQFPAFSSTKVHCDYVDCVRWIGDLLLSKSTESLIRLWKPNPARKPDAVMILREFKVDDANIWFVRFEHDPYCQRLVCGNQRGRVFLFNIFESDEIGVTRSQELTHLKCNTTIRHAAFSPNRKCIIACCDDGTIWRYDVAKSGHKKKKR